MGMFDKDRIFGGKRMDKEFLPEEPFVLFDIGIVAEGIVINPDENMPPATKTALVAGKLDTKGKVTGEVLVVGTLASAIAAKAREKEDGDLPAIVNYFVVPSGSASKNDATVLQFVAPYDGAVPKDLPSIEAVRLVQDEPPH